jgi:hypothetical protein
VPFEDRVGRLDAITRGLTLAARYPLVRTIALGAPQLARIRGAVTHYLWSALSAYFRTEVFALREDLLEAYGGRLLKLPNITPGGLVLVKEPMVLSYNALHRAVADAFAEIGLPAHFSHGLFPINVRLAEGTPNARVDSRPRASAKVHTDIWAGDPIGAVGFMLPLLGDIERVRVDWFEPRAMPDHLLCALADYDHGTPVAADAERYADGWQRGGLLMFDSFALHQTQRPGPGLRVSLDFRCVARQQVASDGAMADVPRTLLPMDDWLDYGHGRVLVTQDPLVPYTQPDRPAAGYPVVIGTRPLAE